MLKSAAQDPMILKSQISVIVRRTCIFTCARIGRVTILSQHKRRTSGSVKGNTFADAQFSTQNPVKSKNKRLSRPQMPNVPPKIE